MAHREQLDRGAEWDPVKKHGRALPRPRGFDSYISYAGAKQTRVGVPASQADDPVLTHLLAYVLQKTQGDLLRTPY